MDEKQIERWRYPRFFTRNIFGNTAAVSGADAKHIAAVLRMRAGNMAVLCDGKKNDYLSKFVKIDGDNCIFEILEKSKNEAEPSVHLRLFQALPKGDKMDFIVQKAVECGASEIIPLYTQRCVSKPDAKAIEKKTLRWQRIAFEAAKQCGRGIVPSVGSPVDLNGAAEICPAANTRIFFYECSKTPLKKAMTAFSENIDIMIGSEGGFDKSEAALMESLGFAEASMGKRILRCETAPIAAISIIMNLTGNM